MESRKLAVNFSVLEWLITKMNTALRFQHTNTDSQQTCSAAPARSREPISSVDESDALIFDCGVVFVVYSGTTKRYFGLNSVRFFCVFFGFFLQDCAATTPASASVHPVAPAVSADVLSLLTVVENGSICRLAGNSSTPPEVILLRNNTGESNG